PPFVRGRILGERAKIRSPGQRVRVRKVSHGSRAGSPGRLEEGCSRGTWSQGSLAISTLPPPNGVLDLQIDLPPRLVRDDRTVVLERPCHDEGSAREVEPRQVDPGLDPDPRPFWGSVSGASTTFVGHHRKDMETLRRGHGDLQDMFDRARRDLIEPHG